MEPGLSNIAPANIEAAKNSIAVLPLQNLNGDFSVDYLRYALADEIANTLTYSRTLDVRPSAVTRKYVSADLDLKQVGRELHVATVLTGHFQKQGNHLLVTVEAIETGTERLLWQTNLNGSTQDLIGMQEQMAKHVRQGLLPMLGAAGGFLETSTRPSNQEAYELYLRSVAVSHDAAPNREAIKSLEHAVQLDPNYAPAWSEVGQRYYYDSTYSNGGEQMFQRSNVALERAWPSTESNLRGLSTHCQSGGPGGVRESLRRRPWHWSNAARRTPWPTSLWAMFSVTPACWRNHPANVILPLPWHRETTQFRSCAWAFMELGRFDRASDFIQVDAGSEWANYATPSLLLREGRVAEAREAVKRMADAPHYHRDLLEALLGLRPAAELDRMAHDAETSQPSDPDPETSYYQGAIYAYADKKEAAFHMLKTANRAELLRLLQPAF